MPDLTLVCRDCQASFVFTEGEQAFFREKAFSPPTRCPECRRRRKAEQANTVAAGNPMRRTR